MPQGDDIKIGLDIAVDQRTIKQAEQALDRLRIRVAQTEAATGQLDNEGRKQISTLQKQVSGYKQAAAAMDRLSDNTDAVTSSLRRQGEEFDRISKQQQLAGDFQSNLGATRGLAGLAGAGGASTGLDAVGELGVLSEELPRLKVAIKGMPETIRSAVDELGGGLRVGLVGGIAVVTAAIVLFRKRAEEAKQAQIEIITAEQEVADFARTASDEAIRARLDEINADIESARFRKEDDESRLAAQQAQISSQNRSVESIQRFNDALGTQDIGLDSIKDKLAEETAEVERLEAAHAELTGILERQRTGIGERGATAEARDSQAFVDGMREILKRRSLELGQELLPITDEQIRSMDAQGQVVNDLLERIIQMRSAAEAAEDAESKRFALILSNREKTAAKLEEAERAEQERADARLSREKEFEQATERVATIREQITKLELNSANRIKKLNEDLTRRESSITTTRDDAISEAGRTAENARTEAARKAGLDRVKAEQDTAKALERIQRQFGNTRIDAIQDRDAVALDAAKRQRIESLKSEKDQGRDRLREIDRQFSEQTRVIDKRLREQTRLARKRADQQLKIARDAAGRTIRLEQEKLQIERNLGRRRVLETIAATEQSNLILAQGYNIANQQAANFVRNLIAQFSSNNSRTTTKRTRTVNRPVFTNQNIRRIRATF